MTSTIRAALLGGEQVTISASFSATATTVQWRLARGAVSNGVTFADNGYIPQNAAIG
jgi:hypothetical protein